MTDATEKQFFAALERGDRELIDRAFEGVYVKYAKLIAFVVGKYVSDRETIKEIVNDTFIGFFNHAVDVNGSVKYYLTVSARNNAVNYLKKQGRSVVTVPMEYAEKSGVYEGRSYVVERLDRVLGKETTDIILLHVTEGYTFKEIAKIKGMKLNTVITVYNRAIKKFKESEDLA